MKEIQLVLVVMPKTLKVSWIKKAKEISCTTNMEMVNQLCGDDPVKWQEAESAAIRSLECRLELWNSIHDQL